MTHSYGWKRDLPDQRDWVFQMPTPASLTPVSLLPDFDMRATQPPVFDQGQLGSCTGNGIAAELEAQNRAERNNLTVLSRLFIYYNERVIEGTVASDAGASIRDGIKSVASQGVCPESEWPYAVSKFAVKPPASCYTDALKFKALVYESVDQDLTLIKAALSPGRGLVIGISVYESFESEEVANTGIVPLPKFSESLLGGHCVRLVGYTDNGLPGIPANHFIGMNSWGTGWGLKGFFAIPYAYITNPNLCDDLWSITATS